MAKGRNFARVTKRAQAGRLTRDQVIWGLHQRAKAAASLGNPNPPSKAQLRQQAAEAWQEFMNTEQGQRLRERSLGALGKLLDRPRSTP